MTLDRCCVDGCNRIAALGYIACSKHVRARRRLIRRIGIAAVATAWRHAR